jgi:hypothetical protein
MSRPSGFARFDSREHVRHDANAPLAGVARRLIDGRRRVGRVAATEWTIWLWQPARGGRLRVRERSLVMIGGKREFVGSVGAVFGDDDRATGQRI